MTNETWFLLILAILNVFQFAFWSWQNQMLVNKLMCRDLAEYKYIVEPKKIEEPRSYRDYEAEIEESEILKELNGQFAR